MYPIMKMDDLISYAFIFGILVIIILSHISLLIGSRFKEKYFDEIRKKQYRR